MEAIAASIEKIAFFLLGFIQEIGSIAGQLSEIWFPPVA